MKRFFKQKNIFKKACPTKPWRSGGFTLVETLVAVLILSMAIVALMTALSSGISNINSAKKKMVASYLAQEGIESIHNMRDNYILVHGQTDGWNKFVAILLDADCANSCDNTIFPVALEYGINRRIKVEGLLDAPGTGQIKVISYVSWSQGANDRSIYFTEILFNWIQL